MADTLQGRTNPLRAEIEGASVTDHDALSLHGRTGTPDMFHIDATAVSFRRALVDPGKKVGRSAPDRGHRCRPA